MLTKMLKQSQSKVEAQEEESKNEDHLKETRNAFEEFRLNKKINTQSDIQAVGQLILLLMKHTDLDKVKNSITEKLSNLVKSCSFEYKEWSQVLAHSFFTVKMKNAYIFKK